MKRELETSSAVRSCRHSWVWAMEVGSASLLPIGHPISMRNAVDQLLVDGVLAPNYRLASLFLLAVRSLLRRARLRLIAGVRASSCSSG